MHSKKEMRQAAAGAEARGIGVVSSCSPSGGRYGERNEHAVKPAEGAKGLLHGDIKALNVVRFRNFSGEQERCGGSVLLEWTTTLV